MHPKVKRGWKHIGLDYVFSSYKDQNHSLWALKGATTTLGDTPWHPELAKLFPKGQRSKKGDERRRWGKGSIKTIKTIILYGKGVSEFLGETGWTPCFPITSLHYCFEIYIKKGLIITRILLFLLLLYKVQRSGHHKASLLFYCCLL